MRMQSPPGLGLKRRAGGSAKKQFTRWADCCRTGVLWQTPRNDPVRDRNGLSMPNDAS